MRALGTLCKAQVQCRPPLSLRTGYDPAMHRKRFRKCIGNDPEMHRKRSGNASETIRKRLDFIRKRLDSIRKRLDSIWIRLDSIRKHLDSIRKRVDAILIQTMEPLGNASGRVSKNLEMPCAFEAPHPIIATWTLCVNHLASIAELMYGFRTLRGVKTCILSGMTRKNTPGFWGPPEADKMNSY